MGKTSDLEQKYIQLLESRVRDLEARIEKNVSGSEKDEQINTVAASRSPGNRTDNTDNANKASAENSKDGEIVRSANEEAKEEPEKVERYRIVLNSLDPNTGDLVDRPPAPLEKVTKAEARNKVERAFTFRKFMGISESSINDSEIEIESEELQKLLARVTRKYIGSTQSRLTQMDAPYSRLIWAWNTAEQEAAIDDPTESEEEQLARVDLKNLLRIISTSSGDEMLDRYFKAKQNMEDCGQITFETLWTIFPLGCHVVFRAAFSAEQVFFIQHCPARDVDEDERKFTVKAYSLDWDGFTFNRALYELSIEAFPDKKRITELTFYPLSEYRSSDEDRDNIEQLKKRLIARGKEFVRYCIAPRGQQTFRYDGLSYHQRRSGLFRSAYREDDGESEISRGASSRDPLHPQDSTFTTRLKGPVVVDFESYLTYQSSSAPTLGTYSQCTAERYRECSCTACCNDFEEIYHFKWDHIKAGEDEGWSLRDEQYMMLPPRVLGYELNGKRWVQLHVNYLQQPNGADRNNFEFKLKISEENKELIRKSVVTHAKANIMDYIPDKGRGLVILLWGVPGVGKTLTAESVAALAGKPLFKIGASDIGTKSSEVESNLEKVFTLAGLWKAVLLFDEADVFLEARTPSSDIHRNTMVSVLLRVLEYYDGILILTTNRMKSFDLAVQSRIHIAIQYDELDQKQRQEIFNEFIIQLKDKQLVGPAEFDSCIKWVKDEGCRKILNGRQIRNIVSTAMGVAHADNKCLEVDYLRNVSQNTEDFKKALADQEAVFKNEQFRARYGR